MTTEVLHLDPAADESDDHDPPVTVDLRLVAPAAGAWLAALQVVRAEPVVAAVGSGTCVIVVIVGALVRRLTAGDRDVHRAPRKPGTGPAQRHRDLRHALAATCALTLLTVGAVLGTGATQLAARSHGVLPQIAAAGSVGTFTGRVRESALLPPAWPGAPARARCTIAVDTASGGGRASDAVGQVLVIGPPALAEAPYGARVRVVGRVQEGAPGDRVVAVLLTSSDPEVVAEAPRWDALATNVREDVAGLAAPLPGDARALLPGVTVGDTSGVTSDLAADMRVAGLTHVTAVSGAHFSLVALLVLTLATAVRLPRGVRAALVVAAMAAMVLLVHPSPSVVRAAAMGLVAALGLLVGRPHRAPPALCAAVVVLLVLDPWLAGELGFLLSVLATGGLVLLGGPFAQRWSQRCGRTVAQAVAMPVAAQLVCAPAILLVTPNVALYSIPANLLVAPAVAPATVLGLAAAGLASWCPWGAQLLALGAGAACWWIGAVARLVAAAPGAQVTWHPGPAGIALAAGASMCTARLLLARRRR
ncbi:ComEC/Rec2 family competence protein [Cellulomonas sp. URHE0023]|uniref:ComEC/Rec2 family competence protein n=1 Tax=Cellulomonas sp. URHE0023 TaxID=1380354 RepID=UPI00068D10D7|nr:ComEC/Rec2 family competence protein [Cellulomonas sp. URHE0023]